MEELLSIRAYARRRGCHHSYIGRLTKNKKIPLVNGKIDPAQADEILDATTRPNPRKPAPPNRTTVVVSSTGPEALTYAEALARRTAAQAALAEIDLGVTRGELVNRAEFERESQAFDMALRSRLLALPTKLAVHLANQPPAKVCALLEREVHELLAEFAEAAQ